ncbi:MAG: hypothetical protein SH850_06570 [Planctomycetaceae bacterium]|nr:hypothetical protein [Planctomycetaceae bacterium]
MSHNADFDPQPAPVKQKSGCLKWVLIFGAIGGVCVLACCGVFGYGVYLFKPTMVQSSPEVKALAAEIADFDIPEDFQGKMGMKVDNFMVSMRICDFEHQTGRGHMQLVEFKVKFGNPKDHEAQLKRQMQEQGAAEMKTLNIVKSETREITVLGQPAQFTFAEGQDASTSTSYHDVQGQFTGKNGVAKLHLQVEDEVWDEEAVVQMLEAAK